MTEQKPIDWHSNAQGTALTLIASVFTAFGGLFTVASIAGDAGVFLLIAAVVVLATGMVGWLVRLSMAWWQRESRAQMLTLVAAITRNDELSNLT